MSAPGPNSPIATNLGPLQVAAAPPLAWHVSGQRQPREGVAGQEALAGEVAVAVEVAELLLVVLVLEQPELVLRVHAAALRELARVRLGGVVEHPAVLFPLLGQRRPVQLAPPVAGGTKLAGRGPQGVVDPVLGPPRVWLVQARELSEDRMCTLGRPAAGRRVSELAATGAGGLPRTGSRLSSSSMAMSSDIVIRLSEAHAGLGQPDGVDVRADKVFVGEVQARWRDGCPPPSAGIAGSSTDRARCRSSSTW